MRDDEGGGGGARELIGRCDRPVLWPGGCAREALDSRHDLPHLAQGERFVNLGEHLLTELDRRRGRRRIRGGRRELIEGADRAAQHLQIDKILVGLERVGLTCRLTRKLEQQHLERIDALGGDEVRCDPGGQQVSAAQPRPREPEVHAK